MTECFGNRILTFSGKLHKAQRGYHLHQALPRSTVMRCLPNRSRLIRLEIKTCTMKKVL